MYFTLDDIQNSTRQQLMCTCTLHAMDELLYPFAPVYPFFNSPSSISGGKPPTNTFLENLSIRSSPDCELGEPRDGEFMFGTVWSREPSSSR